MRHFGIWMLPQLALCLLPAAAATSSGPALSRLRSCSSTSDQSVRHLLLWCALCYDSVVLLFTVKMFWCLDKKVTLQQFYLLWSTSCSDSKKIKDYLTWISTHCIMVVVWDVLQFYIMGKGSCGYSQCILAEFLYGSWEKWELWELPGLRDLISLRPRRIYLRALRQVHRMVPGSSRSLWTLDIWDLLF